MPIRDSRPDPDTLLARITAGDSKDRGRLKLFLGSAPGVGKTYAMLTAAQALAREGVDVVVGYVEAHGRPETDRLVEGLEVLPRKDLGLGQQSFQEFDLDAALERRPSVLLVDELAHTNTRGCRHEKRYMDVLELLDAGLDVYTTMNVQHLDSVNSTVEQITGVRVRETVPDMILARADDVELIDLPASELQNRMRAGKIYKPEAAARALKNFFSEGNLLALRELALRKAAGRVDADLQKFRRLNEITDSWPAAERLLVCVGPSPLSGKVIRTAHRMAESLRADWVALSVNTPGLGTTTDTRTRVLEHLRLADALGAQTHSVVGDSIATAVLDFARSNNFTMIVIGKPTHARWKDRLKGSLVDDLIRGSGKIEVHVLSGGVEIPKRTRSTLELPPIQGVLFDVAIALSVAAVCGLVARVTATFVNPSDQVMLFLVGVLMVSYTSSLRASLFTALVSVAVFNFFFIPPLYTFAVTDTKYILTFTAMVVFGALVSSLVWRVRTQANSARIRQEINARLFQITRSLANCNTNEGIAEAAVGHLREALGLDATVFFEREKRLNILASDGLPLNEQSEWVTARWVLQNGVQAGVGTGTLPGVAGRYIPLMTEAGAIGVVGLRATLYDTFSDPEKRDLLENMVVQISQAFERLSLRTMTHEAEIVLTTERLRNSLLSSISHDVRTPIAAIIGSAELLRDHSAGIDQTRQSQLVDSMYKEATRLQRLVENVLQITKIEAGEFSLKRDWHLLEELVGAALNDLETTLKGRTVEVDVASDLVYLDNTSVTTALRNLIDNANKYSAKNTTIIVKGAVIHDLVELSVLDEGVGVEPSEIQTVFDKFARGSNVGTVGGSGLGLAIVKATSVIHGGDTFIRARATGRGSEIGFRMSQRDAPARPVLEVEP